MEEFLIGFLKDFGFPVFVVLWFMFRTEKILKGNTEAINRIADIITEKFK